jgi:nitroreductase
MPATTIDIQTLQQAIANRRSLGLARLKPDAVDPKILQDMLEAANWGQSNGDTEPWRFVVFTGEGRNKLADAFGEAYKMDEQGEFNQTAYDGYRNRAFQSPVWIAIGMEPALNEDGTFQESEDEEIMAVATAVQNMTLVMGAHGLVGMWHSKGTSTHPAVAKALGFESPSRLLGLLFCGWPNVDWPEGERKPLEGKVRWVTE